MDERQGGLAGQAVYSPLVLAVYDALVLGLSNRLAWKCPTRHLLGLYQANLTANHLEVGVGTGYFLDRAVFPNPTPRLVLLDLNAHCLDATAARVRRYRPEVVQANLLEPLPSLGAPFSSVGINYVLHCLPGTLAAKARVFDHLLPALAPAGVVFAATILGVGVQTGFLARRLLRLYNARGIFGNASDGPDDLRRVLEERFTDTNVTTIGAVALFRAVRR